MKDTIRRFIPPILFDLKKKIKPDKYGWFGEYESWEDARKLSSGYEEKEILEKVREAALKVKKGEALYERDGVIFDKVQYSWPVLAGLMYAAAKSCGILKILDFGGSLGSTYYQNKKFLDGLKCVKWCIVEQTHFVEVGKNDFEDERLKFYNDVETCMREISPKTLLLSSVLQYLEKPYEFLDKILKYNFNFLIIDRTPFDLKGIEKVTIQKVPPNIYKASYPCWFFNIDKIISFLKKRRYKIIETFGSSSDRADNCLFEGLIAERLYDK